MILRLYSISSHRLRPTLTLSLYCNQRRMSSSSIHNRHEPSTDLARKWLTPDFFKAMHDYWFRDLSPDALTPDQDTTKRWFAKDESNDQFCRSVLGISSTYLPQSIHRSSKIHRSTYQMTNKLTLSLSNTYLPFLEDVRRLQPSPKDLMLDPEENPTNTLTLLLLLDQIPRNVFRGQESKVVFTIYDKLALDIALRSLFPKTHQAAISKVPPMSSLADNHDNNNNNRTWYEDDTVTMDDEEGLNSGLDNIPQYRYHCGYRMWFYLPLMHSESLKIHDWADKRFQAMIADMESLRERPLTSSSGKT